jgi:hypothetical protein
MTLLERFPEKNYQDFALLLFFRVCLHEKWIFVLNLVVRQHPIKSGSILTVIRHGATQKSCFML